MHGRNIVYRAENIHQKSINDTVVAFEYEKNTSVDLPRPQNFVIRRELNITRIRLAPSRDELLQSVVFSARSSKPTIEMIARFHKPCLIRSITCGSAIRCKRRFITKALIAIKTRVTFYCVYNIQCTSLYVRVYENA